MNIKRKEKQRWLFAFFFFENSSTSVNQMRKNRVRIRVEWWRGSTARVCNPRKKSIVIHLFCTDLLFNRKCILHSSFRLFVSISLSEFIFFFNLKVYSNWDSELQKRKEWIKRRIKKWHSTDTKIWQTLSILLPFDLFENGKKFLDFYKHVILCMM